MSFISDKERFRILSLTEREKDLISRAFILGIIKGEKRLKVCERQALKFSIASAPISPAFSNASTDEIDVLPFHGEEFIDCNRPLFFLK